MPHPALNHSGSPTGSGPAPADLPAAAAPLLRMVQIARRFGTTIALADVSLEVRRGEVHALVGENGAGKSTLMKILAGAEVADSGLIEFNGQPFTPRQPLDSLRAGIAMIYQEFNLAPHLSVEANLLLGREKRLAGLFLASRLSASNERALCRAAMARLNLTIPLDTRINTLGVADQQMIEIARAIMSGAKLIIMDEPTSALATDEVQRLFTIIRQLRCEGISIVYISHFLEELEQIADRITIIRDGKTIATGKIAGGTAEKLEVRSEKREEGSGCRVQGSGEGQQEGESSVVSGPLSVEHSQRTTDNGPRTTDNQQLTVDNGQLTTRPFTRAMIVRAMVGREVSEMYPRTAHEIGRPLLEIRGLCGQDLPRNVSLTLHRGEILGIAGLVGAGRTETLRALFGLDPRTGGSATLHASAAQDHCGAGVPPAESRSQKSRAGVTPAPQATSAPQGPRALIPSITLESFSPRDWNRRGVGMLSEDRKTEGLAQNLSCLANITLPSLRLASIGGFINKAFERRRSNEIGRTLAIKWAGPEHKISSLSGGNQQKVALARLLYTQADVLLLDEPTRGIDVGAKVDLYKAIGALAAAGKAIIMVSSYLPELFGTCDRIAVMARGALSTPRNVEDLTPEIVMHLAVGGA